ncbi:tape measure protein [Gordonia Phage Sephiroth]|uniref:Tape measure protein n=1 Tax=Gordonia Phage Sephiroth TaxID=2767553 RepID=A0A7G9UZB5_9CAUD|nr:tail length tape measure protein [Gordonia Phage Sephiroth]QNN99370.1 tape measure protein [Gordonia Phage Sephiroth]
MAEKFSIGDAVLNIVPSLDEFKERLDSQLKAYREYFDVVIRPDMDQFFTKLESDVKAAAAAAGGDVKVTADTSQAQAEIAATKAAVEQAGGEVKIEADASQALAEAAATKAAIESTSAEMDVRIDTAELREALSMAREEADIRRDIAMAREMANAAAEEDERKAAAKMEQNLRRELSSRQLIVQALRAANDVEGMSSQERESAMRRIRAAEQEIARDKARARVDTNMSNEDLLNALRSESVLRSEIARARASGDEAGLTAAREELGIRQELERAERARARAAAPKEKEARDALTAEQKLQAERSAAAGKWAEDRRKERERREAAEAKEASKKVDLSAAEAAIVALQAEIDALSGDIEVGADTDEARMRIAVLEERIRLLRSDLRIGADTVEARARVAILAAQIRAMKADIRVGADTRDAAEEVDDFEARFRVVQSFQGVNLFSLGNITSAIVGIGTIIGLLGGVVAAAGAAATSLGAMGGAVAIGSSGVFGAFNELRAQNQPGAQNSGQQAVQAMREQREAVQRVADAQQNLRNASSDLASDQDRLRDATKDATREIRDQRLELEDARLAQEGSAIAVARAKENYTEVKRRFDRGEASALDLQEADLRVRSSQSRLRSSQNNLSDTREETRTVVRNGVANNPNVVAARAGVADGIDRVAKARRELNDARTDASAAVAGAGVDRFTQAMARLSPNAQDFVTKVRSLGGAWTDLRMATQDALFAGFGDTFTDVASKQMPELQRGMVQLAGVANTVLSDSLRRVSATFSEFTANGTSAAFFDAVAASFSGFAPFVESLVRVLTELTIGMGPQLGVFFEDLGQFLENQAPMWTRMGSQVLGVMSLLLPVFDQMFQALEPVFSEGFEQIVRIFSALADALSENQGPLTEFTSALGSMIVNLIKAGSELMPLFLGVLEFFMDAISGINPEVLAVILGSVIALRSVAGAFIAVGNTAGRLIAAGDSLAQAFAFLRLLPGRIAASSIGMRVAAAASLLWGKAMLLVNGIMNASPAMKIAMAVTALAAAAVYAYQNFEPFRKVVDSVWQALQRFWDVLNGSGGGQAAMALGALPLLFMRTRLGAMAAAGATRVWGAAQLFLNAAMRANPIGLIVTALVALVAGLVYAYKNSETFRNFVNGLWEGLKNVAGWIADVAVGAWNLLSDAFSKGIEFVKKYWDILILGLGPIGWVISAVVNLVKNFDKIKSGLGVLKQIWDKTWNWISSSFENVAGGIGKWFSNLTRGFDGLKENAQTVANAIKRAFSGIKDVMLTPIRAIGRVLQRIPTKFLGVTITGAATLHRWGETLARLNVGGSAAGAGRKPNGMLYGPGTGTSDDILGVDGSGMPTALVSTDEAVVNARGVQKYWPVIDAINKDTLGNLFGIKRLATGGAVIDGASDGRSSKEILGPTRWDQEWQEFFRARGADTPDKAFKYMGDNAYIGTLYRSGWLPPDGSNGEEDRRLGQVDSNNFDQRAANERQKLAEIQDEILTDQKSKESRKLFDEAWTKWFNDHGGNSQRDGYLNRNPEVAERWRSGQFPPGDERTQESVTDDLKSGGDGSDGYSGDTDYGGDTDFGGDSGGYGGPDNIDTTGAGGDPEAVELTQQEQSLLMGQEINTSLWRAVKAEFPDAVLTSAKGAHDDDGGYHPAGKAIDIGGPSDLLLRINHWLFETFGNKLAELIYAPAPPAKLMYNKGGQLIEDQQQLATQVYAGDLAGHTNHVHVSADQAVQVPDANTDYDGGTGGYGGDDGGSGDGGYGGDPLYDNGEGFEQDDGPKASTAIADAMRGDYFDPKRYYDNVTLELGDTLWDAVTGALSLDTTYYDAYGQAVDETERLRLKKLEEQGGKTPNVGGGDPNSPETQRLLSNGGGQGDVGGKIKEEDLNHTYTPGGGVEQWRPLFSQILEFGGFSMSLLDPGLAQMKTESGGNPKAINNSDSNAAKGTPSKGLMQVIQPTFDAHKSPQLKDDIYDPAANIYAGTNYAVKRYPNLEQVWGNGHGYATGGKVKGKGGRRTDDIPAWLSDEEFVVNADSAIAAGPLLDWINESPEMAGRLAEMLAGGAGAIPGIGPAIAASAPLLGDFVEQGVGGLAVGAETLVEGGAQFLSIAERDRVQAIKTLGGASGSAPLSGGRTQAPAQVVNQGAQYGDVHTQSLREFQQFIEKENAHVAFSHMAGHTVR